jgi:DNA-binding XRE family transcriptional regulator
VVMPVAEYERLRQQADAARVDELRGRDFLPAEVADRIMAGEHPLKVLGEWRGLSQSHLAERTGLPQPTIALLERGRRKGTLAHTACRSKPSPAGTEPAPGGVDGPWAPSAHSRTDG